MPGLYIHIPFCARKCAYCDFYSGRAADTDDFLRAAEREMRFRQNAVPDGAINTIYIGGGTPSLLPHAGLQSLLDTAAQLWDCTGLKETTLEANPEDLTGGYLNALAETGFDRLSIGIQSLDDRLLRKMNRRHTAQRAKKAVTGAREAGFKNLTIDLIYGIPGMSRGQWDNTLREAVALGVDHISAYHLSIEPGTAFSRMASEGKLSPVSETESRWQYETLRGVLAEAGFEHYEISNFARPGFRAVHNGSYWSGEPYLGIGPSAHSYDGRIRSWAVSDTAEYIKGAGGTDIYESEELTPADIYNEFVMTSLRRADGIDVGKMERLFGPHAAGRLRMHAGTFIGNGCLVEKEGRIYIPPEHFLVSDYIISTLFMEGREYPIGSCNHV